MAGPNLELFKFGIYLFFPIGMMYYYGNPEWWFDHVLPYKEKFFPQEKMAKPPLPQDHSAVRRELDRIKAERLARRQAVHSDEPNRLV